MGTHAPAGRFRKRLALLMLASLAPACALMLFASNQQRVESVSAARAAARSYVNVVGLEFRREIAAMRDLLITFGLAPSVVSLDAQRCRTLVNRISREHLELLNIGVANLNGDVVCSALSAPGQVVNIADRDYFREALQRDGFAASRYYSGRLTGLGSVAFAQPVRGEYGLPVGVAYVATRFHGFEHIVHGVGLGRGDLLLVLDDGGTIVGRYPDESGWAGRNFAGHPLVDAILSRRNGEGQFESLDGVPRFFVFRPVDAFGERAYSIAVAVDERPIAAAARRTLLFGVGAVALVALAGLIILWFGAARSFGHRLDAIVGTARRIAEGDSAARVRFEGVPADDELDRIAEDFNAMAEALQRREQDWRLAMDALDASRARSAAILDSLSARIVVLDANACVVAVNAAWQGESRTPAVGEDYLEVLTADAAVRAGGQAETLRATIEAVLAAPDAGPDGVPARGVEYACVDDRDERWYEMRVTPLKGDDGGVVVAHEDIGERKRLALKLEELVVELERSNRELQDFAYVASHDLQEPLRKVTAFAGRFESAYAGRLDERGLDYLARMTDAARRMQRLIDDLLKMSRVHTRAQPMRPVSLDAVVAAVLSDLEERIRESGARIAVEPLPEIVADETQIRQVMQNLIGNAIKFVPAGAVPDIEVATEATRPGWVRICVRDRGIGLPNGVDERIFAPFVRLHGRDEYDGSGLGLAVVRRIVERHRGRIEAAARPGGGACFCFELPRPAR